MTDWYVKRQAPAIGLTESREGGAKMLDIGPNRQAAIVA